MRCYQIDVSKVYTYEIEARSKKEALGIMAILLKQPEPVMTSHGQPVVTHSFEIWEDK